MRSLRTMAAAGFLLAVVTSPGRSQQDTTELGRLKAQVEAITRELEVIRLGREVVVAADSSHPGFGPAASRVYQVRQGASLGGYGELVYENFAARRQDGTAAGRTDRIDALRAVLYVGYRFDDRLLFNSEIEFEHASTGAGGEVSLEFAYLEYRFARQAGARAGLLLVPLGFINELHEPPTFLGVRRPETERHVIPSTWRENGLGLFGEAGDVAWRAYLVNGFMGEGFTAAGLRDGRQDGAQAAARHFGLSGRADYTGVPGLLLGAAAYAGRSGQSDSIAARTVIWEGHAEYRRHGLELRGLVAVATVDDVAALNAAAGHAGTESIGERLWGWYAQAGYDVLRGTGSRHQLVPFLRFERLNSQAEVPAGFAADPANDRRFLTLGAVWRPVPGVAVKADYQVTRTEARSGVNQLNVGIGYLF